VSADDTTSDEGGARTITVTAAVYRRVEAWRDAVLARGIDALPPAMRGPMRRALTRADGKHKGVVGMGVVLGAAFEALPPEFGAAGREPRPLVDVFAGRDPPGASRSATEHPERFVGRVAGGVDRKEAPRHAGEALARDDAPARGAFDHSDKPDDALPPGKPLGRPVVRPKRKPVKP
jgi:hypothetical protein